MTSGQALIDSLWAALDEAPGDGDLLQVLADALEDGGESVAASRLRRIAQSGRRPWRYRGADTMNIPLGVGTSFWTKGALWWARDDRAVPDHMLCDWGHSLACLLPSAIWRRLRHDMPYAPAVFKEHVDARSAYLALVEALDEAPGEEGL